ncbi:MAG TPA: hypothetical protein VJX67_14710, partial [Blastocatellia bacterium]|nr:hypothetical protein [Blastocatellia bacterium]
TPSPARRDALCPHFGDCGGCQLQHMTYPAQLSAKAGFIRDALTRVGRIDWPREITIHSAGEYGYRTRAQIKLETPRQKFTATASTAGEAAESGNSSTAHVRIGFNRAGSHSVCDVETCPILTPGLNSGLAALRSAIQRTVASRARVSGAAFPRQVEMAGGDSGVSFHPGLYDLPSGAIERLVAGIRYRFGPATFFQSNNLVLEEMIETATAGHSGGLALDLYAGTGLFTAQLASKFRRVIGIESDAAAVEFAIETMSINNINNVTLRLERVETSLAEYAGRVKHGKEQVPDLVLLDPPRAGAPEAVRTLAELQPRRICYVSCDPVTMARDILALQGAGYQINEITGFDMFPQTYHVETVAQLVAGPREIAG